MTCIHIDSWMDQQKCSAFKEDPYGKCKNIRLGCPLVATSSLTFKDWEINFTPEGEELKDTIKLLIDYVESKIPLAPYYRNGVITIGDDCNYIPSLQVFSVAYGPTFLANCSLCISDHIEKSIAWFNGKYKANSYHRDIDTFKNQTIVPYEHVDVAFQFINKMLVIAGINITDEPSWILFQRHVLLFLKVY